jgi:hypothetical protein
MNKNRRLLALRAVRDEHFIVIHRMPRFVKLRDERKVLITEINSPRMSTLEAKEACQRLRRRRDEVFKELARV